MMKPVSTAKQMKQGKHFDNIIKKELESTYLENKDTFLELVQLVELLKERDILRYVNLFLSKQEKMLNDNQLNILKKGITKGIEEATSTLNSGKEINTFQMMKLLKDPDINRTISFFANFLKGLGKNMKDF